MLEPEASGDRKMLVDTESLMSIDNFVARRGHARFK